MAFSLFAVQRDLMLDFNRIMTKKTIKSISADVGLKDHFMEILTSSGLAANFASMLYALLYTALLFVPAFVLFKHKIFIKL